MAAGRPIPAGRGRWRLTLHNRQFTDTWWGATAVAELTSARSRQLVQAWDTPAVLTFTMDGRDPAAAGIVELQTDVMGWRWDDQPGAPYNSLWGCDVPVFRGVVTQSEDEISEDVHTVNFTCHDYLAMLGRRHTVGPAQSYTQQDQDVIAANFVYLALNEGSASGHEFGQGSYLPLNVITVNPDGTRRNASGVLRDRTYTAGTPLAQMLDDLAKVIGGFDYDLITAQHASDLGFLPGTGVQYRDQVRVFYPSQGVNRLDCPMVYGSTVSTVTRTVDSGDYSNYWRTIGAAPPGAADGTPPMFSEQWTAAADSGPVGLWMNVDSAADVTLQPTLDQQAQGDLAVASTLVPSYTLGLRPGAYRWGAPNMGDTVPLVIQSGRLNVVSIPPAGGLRVLGITYAIGDDGDEDVSLVVGRPATTLIDLLTATDADTNALVRR